MLFNRQLEIKFVKAPKPTIIDTTPAIETATLPQLAEEIAKTVAVTYVVIFASSVALYALGQIAIIAFEHNLND